MTYDRVFHKQLNTDKTRNDALFYTNTTNLKKNIGSSAKEM